MRTAATCPLDFFLQDWDKDGYLHVFEDIKAWWSAQNLTGFHCHHRKTFDTTNNIKHEPEEDNSMEIKFKADDDDDDFPPPSSFSKNKRKSQDKNKWTQTPTT
jgi:hypothetical protein